MASEKNDTIADVIPPLAELERNFLFIDNNNLRANIALAFQHIIFLIAVIDREHAENTTIGSSAHKSIIIYMATIIEGCLHHCVRRFLDAGKIKEQEIMKKEWVPKNPKNIYTISEDEYVCGTILQKKIEPYTERLQFQELNRACKRAGILTDNLFRKAENIREKRNKIHLAGIGDRDSVYSKADVRAIFDDAEDVKKRVATLLNEL